MALTSLPEAPTRTPLKGVRFHRLTEDDVVHAVVDSAMADEGGWVCPVNVDVLRQHDESAEVRELVAEAEVVVADGMPLIWASRVAGAPLPERVAGSSLIHTLPRYAAERGARVFLLGGNEGAAEAAGRRLVEDNPGLKVVGTVCPPFGFEKDPALMREITDAVIAARPHIVFVGLGFPKQERLIRHLRTVEPDAWYVSCGVSFSFASGEIKRAPVLLQRLGLEWLHRLVQEPRRLFRRYLVDGPPFLLRLFADALRSRRTGPPAS
jgi:N-acetylglucosaminyldiphosphoundecaprenol N-acetyl-beta-D-mannosaminyltransferase